MNEPSTKAEVARRQLGTALSLFIDDQDPVSVHSLACGGGEIAGALAEAANKTSFLTHTLNIHADMTVAELKGLRNQYWNAMKHSETRDGKARDDDQLLADFDDSHNDHILYIGWHDYALAIGYLPIEAQVFQIWYFANYPEKLAKKCSASDFSDQFRDIRNIDRAGKKRMLRQKIEWARQQKDIMQDSRTDLRKLILSRTATQLARPKI